jgi:hypothetical protein
MQQTKAQRPDPNQFLSKEKVTSSQMQQTKDQGPDPNLFLCKE